MKVMCIEGHEGVLKAGEIYTVVGITNKGNYILEEVEVPEGHTSFSSTRFNTVEIFDDWDSDWTEELERIYLEEQPSAELNA
jgi:hypothetical protein